MCRKRKKHRGFIAIGMVLLMIVVSFPFENYFLSFNTPRSAFKYFSGKGTILCVNESGSDTIVVSKEGSTINVLYLYKHDGKYRSPFVGVHTNVIAHNDKRMVARVDVPDKDKCWFIVTLAAESSSDVTDSSGAEAMSFLRDDYWDNLLICAENVDDNYYLQFGEEKFFPERKD